MLLPPSARVFALTTLSLAAIAPCRAQDAAADLYRVETVTVEEGELAGRDYAYRVFVPADRKPDEALPVVLFLHGAGERGDDNARHLQYLPERIVRPDYQARYRAIVVAPQCPRGTMWMSIDRQARTSAAGPWLDAALAALEKTLANENGDPDRVYLTGLSMGGFGSWHLACAHPELFAGVVPICGGGDEGRAEQLRGLPVWAWHGADDRVVGADLSRRMVRAVRAAGGKAHYTELPGVGHNSWDAAYALDPEGHGPLDWLFRRRRGEAYLGRVMGCDQAGPRLVRLDLDRPWDESAIGWSWSGEGLSDEQRAWFANPTDAKPLDLTRLVCTASGGGVFVVRIADRKVEFAAHAGANPHSVTALADGTLLVASSTDDRLARFDPARGAEPLQVLELVDAHGVCVLDDAIWALGGKELVELALREGELEEISRVRLPQNEASERFPRHGGHDLIVDPRGGLLLSDMFAVWRFGVGDRAFTPFEPLPSARDVKSIDALGPEGPWVALLATEQWWSSEATFVGVELDRELERAKFYKLRAWP